MKLLMSHQTSLKVQTMSTPISEEELNIVKEAVLSPIILDTLERDLTSIKSSDLKMARVYARMLRKAQNAATRKYYEVKQVLRKRGIKIYEETRDKDQVKAKYLLRGYHHDFGILWPRVRSEVETRIADLIGVELTNIKTDP
jgi:predicted nucleotide-binding protein (sugar kinase/HSP70/actin superfamily)